jgi:hypothetical protein
MDNIDIYSLRNYIADNNVIVWVGSLSSNMVAIRLVNKDSKNSKIVSLNTSELPKLNKYKVVTHNEATSELESL